jgi:formylglycine-generating enzyme required for sulfatase activity
VKHEPVEGEKMRNVTNMQLLYSVLLAVLMACGSVQQGANQASKMPQHRAGEIKTVCGIEMAYVPIGKFIMGSADRRNRDANPRHEVTLNGFWMGKYEVTQAQYREVMGRNLSYFTGDTQRPVETVCWYEAVEFCNGLSKKAGLRAAYTVDKTRKDPNNRNAEDRWRWIVREVPGSNGFRLPSEAEWEYAARAGSSTRYYWGRRFNEKYCWRGIWEKITTHTVGKKLPNAFGLNDMSGNVSEWCWDWYDTSYYQNSPKVNPRGPSSGLRKVLRGGQWDWSEEQEYYYLPYDSASRAADCPYNDNSIVGFRVVLPDIE